MSSDFDFCETEDSIFAPGELLDTRLASLDPATCTQKTEALEPEPGLDYFLLKEQGCIDGLVLNNYRNASKESVLYIADFRIFRGNIKLQHFGKLKIVAKEDLYLDSVTFLNTLSVQITRGYEKNNKISPLISCSHVWLSSVVAPSFHIHDIASLSLIGDIISCNSFKLENVFKVYGDGLSQLLSADVLVYSASFINWNGAVSSCEKSASNKIDIKNISSKITFLEGSKLVSDYISIAGDLKSETHVYISGLLVSTGFLSIDCNTLYGKGATLKAQNLELVIYESYDADLPLSFSGMIYVSSKTEIRVPQNRPSAMRLEGGSIFSTGSLYIDGEFVELTCDGCKMTVGGKDISSIRLNKFIMNSEIQVNIDTKKLPALFRKTIWKCYEPLLWSERCTVEITKSQGENLFTALSPYYIKIGSVFIEGVLKLDINEIVVKDAAFIIDGKLEFQKGIKKLTVDATKGFRKVTLAPVSFDTDVRDSSGRGDHVKDHYYFSNQDALKYFNKYDVARDFGLISQSERDECIRGQSSRDVYCPIYVEGKDIIRNTGSLQSIFHAKYYEGLSIGGLSVGQDIPPSNTAMSLDKMPDTASAETNNLWSNEASRHKTLLQDSGSITSLENMKNAVSSDVEAVISGDSKVAILKRYRLSAEIALNLDNLGTYEMHSSIQMKEFLKKALPGSESIELIWNIFDYPEKSREFLADDELIKKLFKCVGLEFPIVSLANQNLMQDLLNDLILATVGKLKGISSAKLLEHLVENTCAILDKLKASGAKPGVPLNRKQKELFDAPGVWPFWLTDCPGGHSQCISLELALNEKSIDKMLPSGAKLSADEHIILDGTRLELGMNGNIVAGESIKAKLVGDTRLDGRLLADEIEGHVDGDLKNVGIISGGKVLMFANNIINLGLIEATRSLVFQALGDFIAAGFLGSGGSLSLDVAHKLTLLSLKEIALLEIKGIKEVSQNVAHITSVIAKGAVTISAGNEILNIGAEVVGQSVFISTSDRIVTVPLELYNEVTRASKYCYESYKNAKFIKPVIKAEGENGGESKEGGPKASKQTLGENAPALIEKELLNIKNKSGSVVLRGKKEVQIIGADISGTGDVALVSEEGGISVRSIKPWQETTVITRGSDLFSTWSDSNYSYEEEVLEASIKSGGTLHSYSLKDQEWVGASIKVVSVKLAAGTPEHKASIAIMPMQKSKIIEVESKRSGFSLKIQNGGISFIDKTHNKSGSTSIEQIPTIIEMEGEFLGYSSGQFTIIDPALIDRSEDERGNVHIKIQADEINLEAAPEVEASYSYMNKWGVGVGFSAKGGEFAIKGCVFGKSENKNYKKVTYKTPTPFRGWIELDAKTVKDAGIVYFAQSLRINAAIEIHGLLVNEENESEVKSLFEAGVKFGIKSNLGAIGSSIKGATSSDLSRPEGMINAAFQGYKLYVEVLKLLSAGHGISGGVWFYMHAEQSTGGLGSSRPVPTIIDVSDLQSKSTELQFIGTQVSAYRGYIEAKYMKGSAAGGSGNRSATGGSLDIEILIAGSVSPNIQAALQKAIEKSEFYLNTNIYVSDRLTMKIAGKADLKGVSINAGKLEASFNELVLESLQNVIESKSFGASVGLGLGNGVDLNSIGGQIQDRSRHVVDSLTMLLGRESAHIVVAEALRMNGALIANADRDSDGNFTDHGHLTLKVGELFVQHIYDYDKGVTLGAAVGLNNAKDPRNSGQSYVDFMPTFGAFNKDGITRSTIGHGNAQVGSCNLDDAYGCGASDGASTLNRDVRKTQEFNTNYSIEPITAYFTTIDTDLLKKNFPIDKDGNIDFGKFAKSYFDAVRASLLIKPDLQTIEPDEEPEEDENNNKKDDEKKPEERVEEDSAGGRGPDDEGELSARDRDILNEELQAIEAKILFRKMADDLEAKYGAERAALLLEVGRERLAARLKGLENIKESQYAVDGDKLIIRLPNAGIVPAGVIDRGLDIVFEIVDSAAKVRGDVLKVGKYIVRIHPYVAAAMTAYDIGNYLVESGHANNVVEFAKETASTASEYAQREFAKIKDKVSEGIKSKLKSEARSKVAGKGAANPGPDDFEPDDKLNQEEKNSLKSLEKQLSEHREKLFEYKQNPDKFDNKGYLKNAPTQEIRDRIIEGRIKHLENEIKAFENQISKLKK